LFEKLGGSCGGVKGVRGFGGKEFADVFPVFEGSGKGGNEVVGVFLCVP
jgi:hypothetical protein